MRRPEGETHNTVAPNSSKQLAPNHERDGCEHMDSKTVHVGAVSEHKEAAIGSAASGHPTEPTPAYLQRPSKRQLAPSARKAHNHSCPSRILAALRGETGLGEHEGK